jgi:hypothetical protein
MASKTLRDINTEDFNVMRDMLSEIELKTLQVDPLKLRQFYQPLQHIIFEAWQDACNPDDNFLYK